MCADWPQTAQIIKASSIQKMIIIVSISLIVVSWRQTPFCPRCVITRVCTVILPFGSDSPSMWLWNTSASSLVPELTLSPLHGVTEPVYVVVSFYVVYT